MVLVVLLCQCFLRYTLELLFFFFFFFFFSNFDSKESLFFLFLFLAYASAVCYHSCFGVRALYCLYCFEHTYTSDEGFSVSKRKFHSSSGIYTFMWIVCVGNLNVLDSVLQCNDCISAIFLFIWIGGSHNSRKLNYNNPIFLIGFIEEM